jgi:hypothetical protein
MKCGQTNGRDLEVTYPFHSLDLNLQRNSKFLCQLAHISRRQWCACARSPDLSTYQRFSRSSMLTPDFQNCSFIWWDLPHLQYGWTYWVPHPSQYLVHWANTSFGCYICLQRQDKGCGDTHLLVAIRKRYLYQCDQPFNGPNRIISSVNLMMEAKSLPETLCFFNRKELIRTVNCMCQFNKIHTQKYHL